MLSGGGAHGCGGEPGFPEAEAWSCVRGNGAGPCTGRRVSLACAWRVHVRSTAMSWPVSREVSPVLWRHMPRPQSRAAGLSHIPPELDLRRLRLWAPCCPWGGVPGASSLHPCKRRECPSAPVCSQTTIGEGPGWLAHPPGVELPEDSRYSPPPLDCPCPHPHLCRVAPPGPFPQSPPRAPGCPWRPQRVLPGSLVLEPKHPPPRGSSDQSGCRAAVRQGNSQNGGPGETPEEGGTLGRMGPVWGSGGRA